jgi:hypothetical protein
MCALTGPECDIWGLFRHHKSDKLYMCTDVVNVFRVRSYPLAKVIAIGKLHH